MTNMPAPPLAMTEASWSASLVEPGTLWAKLSLQLKTASRSCFFIPQIWYSSGHKLHDLCKKQSCACSNNFVACDLLNILNREWSPCRLLTNKMSQCLP